MKKKTIGWLVVIVVIILFFVFKQGDSFEADPVDLEDPSLGPENASIVIVEYSDFQCPYCGAAMGTHDQLIARFKGQDPTWEPAVPYIKELAEAGEVRFVFKHYPLGGHAFAQKAAEAAEAAHAQGMFWEYHDLLFENQDRLRESDLMGYAEQLGLDMERFERELKGGAYTASVKKDFAEGSRAGVDGTPAFLVNGQLVSGAQPARVFEGLLAQQ